MCVCVFYAYIPVMENQRMVDGVRLDGTVRFDALHICSMHYTFVRCITHL